VFLLVATLVEENAQWIILRTLIPEILSNKYNKKAIKPATETTIVKDKE
jgi:hypothetical protein